MIIHFVFLLISLISKTSAQFATTGKIIQSASPCGTSFGDGWNRAWGCFYCFWNQYTDETSLDNSIWSSNFTTTVSTNATKAGPKLLKLKNTYRRCNNNPFPCNLNYWIGPRMIDFRHSFYLVDPITKAETKVGCPLTGIGSTEDLTFIQDLNAIVKSDEQDCGGDLYCTKYSLYDLTRSRLVEIARLNSSDFDQCSPTGKMSYMFN